jgi:hypothetical protein
MFSAKSFCSTRTKKRAMVFRNLQIQHGWTPSMFQDHMLDL